MNFDQWIDSVNAQVHGRLGDRVHTEELSWDSAMWKSASGTVVASMNNDESSANVTFDNGEKLSVAFKAPEGKPEIVSAAIAARLSA